MKVWYKKNKGLFWLFLAVALFSVFFLDFSSLSVASSFAEPDGQRCEDCLRLTEKRYTGDNVRSTNYNRGDLYINKGQRCAYSFPNGNYVSQDVGKWYFRSYCGNLEGNKCPDMPPSVVDDNSFRSWAGTLEQQGIEFRGFANIATTGNNRASVLYGTRYGARDMYSEPPIQEPICASQRQDYINYLVSEGLASPVYIDEVGDLRVINETLNKVVFVCEGGEYVDTVADCPENKDNAWVQLVIWLKSLFGLA